MGNGKDKWNDSLAGDFAWTNVNFGEAMADVMTPLTWDVIFRLRFGQWLLLPGQLAIGNIGGRPYFNLSVVASLFHAVGKSQQELFNDMQGTMYTSFFKELQIPLIPLSRWSLLSCLPNLAWMQMKERLAVKNIEMYLVANPAWRQRVRQQLGAVETKAELISLWQNQIAPHIKRNFWTVLGSANEHAQRAMALGRELGQLLGPDEADALLTNLSDDTQLLASLGPLMGLSKVARGEMQRSEYLEQHGHRGPHECELSIPRPAEEADWFDRQLAALGQSVAGVEALLAKRRAEFQAAWQRLQERHPRKAQSLRRQIDQAAQCGRKREAVRSEFAHELAIVRIFALRAGELVGLDDGVFFLTVDEVLQVLSGDKTPVQYIAARREIFENYCALPPYPQVICGRFDPFQWAADPNRRNDVYDSRAGVTALTSGQVGSNIILGAAGSAGRVEGSVRRLDSPAEGGQLLTGEILVTAQTNIGWTMLFPRAAAVVTDVGAPLSHAAIVARELGIPAVVGCGNATMCLKTGDRVRVDGGRGIVEILRET